MVDVRGVTSVTGGAAVPTDDVEDDQPPGLHDGEAVVVEKDAVALAEDALDTLGDEFLSDEMEKELDREERRISSSEEAAKEAMAEDVDGPPQDPSDALARKSEVEALGRELKHRGIKSPHDIRRHLQEHLGKHQGERGPNDDPTLQYGALSILEKMFAEEGDEEMAKAVGEAASELLAEHPTEINKGVIVSEAAGLYASERCGTVSDLRALYMREVVSHKSLAASFTGIMEKHGATGFPDAVGFLLRAAGDDLARMTSTADRTQQKQVLDDLYQLEVLNTIRERTESSLRVLGRSFPVAAEVTPQRIMGDTFDMIENPARMAESNVTRLATEAMSDSLEGRIAFLREYRSIATMIPVRVFEEADNGGGGLRLRERLTNAIVGAQDAADAEEQARLAAR
jgi:type III secretion system YopN/LcrE/InvE/MxiC family regulator